MNETFEYLKTFALLPPALYRFARQKQTLAQAKQIIRERMQHRAENFLVIAERSIYKNPKSPYLPLLRMAGCELGDLRQLVKSKGLDNTLKLLRKEGVYVTFEEFKGRKPIIRNGKEIPVNSWDFNNPGTQTQFIFQTGGSTGAALNVNVDLDQLAARSPYQLVAFEAHDVLDAPTGTWGGMLPHSKIGSMLRRAYIGQLPERWFSPIGWRDSSQWFKYGVATWYILLWMRMCGIHVPLPEIVRPENGLVIAQWIVDTIKKHGRCFFYSQVSSAVRVCVIAHQEGLNFSGATIKAGGEPLTEAKAQQIKRTGARLFSSYGMTEAGGIAAGCANPLDASDVHLFFDAFVLFTHPFPIEGIGITVPAFNLTSLLLTTPKIMLNVQMDDYGIIEERQCGCELEKIGFTTHLRQIHSYSKLTGEGMTLIGTEMVRILEEVLPARFGGSPQDYQLMEQEDEQGFTRLYLIISPSVEISDEESVVEFMLDALRRSSAMADAARIMWQTAHSIKVKRMEPIWTDRGKMMPLHIERLAGSKIL